MVCSFGKRRASAPPPKDFIAPQNRLSAALPLRLHPYVEGDISLASLSTQNGKDELLAHQPSSTDIPMSLLLADEV
jgi:hypothetical protein